MTNVKKLCEGANNYEGCIVLTINNHIGKGIWNFVGEGTANSAKNE